MFSASRKIMSIELDEDILLVLTTLIAAYSLVILLSPRETDPNPPSPSSLMIWYYPKLRLESKSSPLLI